MADVGSSRGTNLMLALLELEGWKRVLGAQKRCVEQDCGGTGEMECRRVSDVLRWIDEQQASVHKSLAQRFVFPASEYPPTSAHVKLSEEFSSLLQEVVQGPLARLCKLVPDSYSPQPCRSVLQRGTTLVEKADGMKLPLGDREPGVGLRQRALREGFRPAAGWAWVDFIVGTAAPSQRRMSGTRGAHANLPSFEHWDSELHTSLHRAGDVINEAQTEMLVALNRLGDGHFPCLMDQSHTPQRPSLWMEVVYMFEDAFEVVVRGIVQLILWCMHQQFLGYQGLAVHPLFTVKALWSYTAAGVSLCPAPPELHERIMQRLKKQLIWNIVPEFGLSQMTKRSVPPLGRANRRTLRSVLMEDAAINRLWETIYCAVGQRCDELNDLTENLTSAYAFYCSQDEGELVQLGIRRLLEMRETLRSGFGDLLQHAGAGAFAVQVEALHQVVLGKVDSSLQRAQKEVKHAGICTEAKMTVARWEMLLDQSGIASLPTALGERLHAFRAGRKTSSKYDKGLDPEAHVARLLEEQRLCMTAPLHVTGSCTPAGAVVDGKRGSNGAASSTTAVVAATARLPTKQEPPSKAHSAVSKLTAESPVNSTAVRKPLRSREAMEPPTRSLATTGSGSGSQQHPCGERGMRCPSPVCKSQRMMATSRRESSSSPPGIPQHRGFSRVKNYASTVHQWSDKTSSATFTASNATTTTTMATAADATPSNLPQEHFSSAENHALPYIDHAEDNEEPAHTLPGKEASPVASRTPSVVLETEKDTDPATADAESCVAKKSVPDTRPKPLPLDTVAANAALERVSALQRTFPFLPSMPKPGVFLEDLNLSDPRLVTLMNRLRAVRGNASVQRNCRSIAMVEDSLCVLLELLAEELRTATLRLLSLCPFLEGRVAGVLLGNIQDLETDGEFQSLLYLYRTAVRERMPTESICQCLVERAEALARSIPFVVEHERCHSHQILDEGESSTAASPLSPPSSHVLPLPHPLGGAEGNEHVGTTGGVQFRAPMHLNSRVSTSSPTEGARSAGASSSDATASSLLRQNEGQQQQQQPQQRTETAEMVEAQRKSTKPSAMETVKTNGMKAADLLTDCAPRARTPDHHLAVCATSMQTVVGAVSPQVSKVVGEDGTMPTARLGSANLVLPLTQLHGARNPVKSSNTKQPLLHEINGRADHSVTTKSQSNRTSLSAPAPAEQSDIMTSAQFLQRQNGAAGWSTGAVSAPDNTEALANHISFDTVRKRLVDEQQQLQQLESLLEGVCQANKALSGGKEEPQVADTAARRNPLEKAATRSPGLLQGVATGGAGRREDEVPPPWPLRATPARPCAANRVPPVNVTTKSAMAAGLMDREAAPIGPFFVEHHEEPDSTRSGKSNTNEKPNCALPQGMSEMRDGHAGNTREHMGTQRSREKGDLGGSKVMQFNSIVDAVVRSSWGAVCSDVDWDRSRALPSLSKGTSWERPASQPKQRLPWGRYTIQNRFPLDVMSKLPKRHSSTPEAPRPGEDVAAFLPAISSLSSAENLPNPLWGNTPRNTTSIRQQYTALCRQTGMRPNSMLLRVLPDTQGDSVSHIDISVNYIGPKGFLPLLHALRSNVGLEHLNLSHNNLENDEIIATVNVLMTEAGVSLRCLDISDNPVSFAGGAAVLRLVQMRSSLTKVQLHGTLIPPQMCRTIQEFCEGKLSAAT